MTVTGDLEETPKKIADYDGALDENYMRTGYGEEVHRRDHGNEYYKGNFKNDTYHGLGYYKNDSIFNAKWTYEGSFFSNAKEGYGRLSLPDNTYFDGLYESDRPFGPGVLTRANGEQDVGFWQSSSIIRLIQPVKCELNDLATDPTRKIWMTKFKKLVEVAPPSNVAIQVAQELNLPAEIAPKLYSMYCKDPNNFLFNYEEFEKVHFYDLRKIEDLVPILSQDDFSQSTTFGETTETAHYGEATYNSLLTTSIVPEEKTQPETDVDLSWDRLRKRINLLVSWNNTPVIINIMVHTFINRIYEKTAGFNVENLLCNNRDQFGTPGPQERACIELLETSNTGDLREFTWLLFANRLNINVQDSKGNGCVIRAASQDHHSLLYLLFLYGADMDVFNDEGFTALNHTLTRYLALVHSIKDWGNAFLPPSSIIKPTNARLWRKCPNQKGPSRGLDKRKLALGMTIVKTTTASDFTHRNAERRNYIFDLSPEERPKRRRRQSLAKKRIESKRENPLQSSRLSEDCFSETEAMEIDATQKTKQSEHDQYCAKLLELRKTMGLLLSFKIHPNISNVPQPAIMLAIFTGDYYLVKMLLEAGANPNARFLPEEGWLTPLHVLVLAKPHPAFPMMMDTLLEHGADPNAQAAVDFAPKTKEFILQGHAEADFPITGLTPLQALLLREDASYIYGKEILKELLLRLHDVTDREPGYFGHSFLSAALVRMNLAFLFTLLHIFNEDPNEELHPIWGNIATAYLIYLGKRNEPETIISLIELEQAGLNPLRIVRTLESEDENVINFALRMKMQDERSNKGAGVPRKSNLQKVSTDIKRKSTIKSAGSRTSRRISVEHPRVSKATQRDASDSTALSKASVVSKNPTKRKIEKELLKKITLLQDLGRDKVDNYIRGVVVRRFIKYLKETYNHDGKVDKNDNPVVQMMNWFTSEDELLKVLSHNVLAGLTFICEREAHEISKILPWEHNESLHPSPTREDKKGSLKRTDKVLLYQLKESIKTQLDSGVSIENINFINKKQQASSTASQRAKNKSRHSAISRKSNVSRTNSDVSTLQHRQHSTTRKISKLRDEDQMTDDTSARPENQATETVQSLNSDAIEELAIESVEEDEEEKRQEFLEKLQPLVTMCAPQVRWAQHYGTKFLKIPKRMIFKTDSFPEVDKKPDLYRVCYNCVKRDSYLELCPVCKLVWYCSSKCNTKDIMNTNSHHRCKTDFYGRGDTWRQYCFDKDGHLCRVPRAGHEDWEADDILNDHLLSKHGKRSVLPEEGESGMMRKSGLAIKRDTKYSNNKLFGKKSSTSIGRRKSGAHGPRDATAGAQLMYGPRGTTAGAQRMQGSRGTTAGVKGKGPDGAGVKEKGPGGATAGAKGKGPGGATAGVKEKRTGGASTRAEGQYHQGSRGGDGKGRLERDFDYNINQRMKDKKGNMSSWKAHQREKKELYLRDARMLRELRQKIPQGAMGDFMKWGYMGMKSLRESAWYKRQKDHSQLEASVKGGMGTNDTLSESYQLLLNQLKVLEGLTKFLGKKVDMNNLFPWVVLRDGELYYKFNQTLFVLENYSFN